ncbi:PssE/Cps14G family polysaccharide biosynthesis glycosyltransferase [Shouchella miscanthi]|uniref:PssE/Cps14G family polysaccharide biosynthesis glycosyltransferase n=1 Tax=Shouchella miscanthi TaxID=2598861 RepID=UPI0011AAE380|nr:PssE/Cps14G family polysaccharide biosynthesis glycosyltransferase [Shouchella miscanthi]
MIYVTVGTQHFQFNRLIKVIDELKSTGVIKEDVYCQIGKSDYKPINFYFSDFVKKERHHELLKEANIYICHGGTSSIIDGLKYNKKTIVVPRLSKYGEHVDDHQLEISKIFYDMNYVELVTDVNELSDALMDIKDKKFDEYKQDTKSKLTKSVISDITSFLKTEV